ncbi:MAG: hypothetical protein ABEL76_06440 [Bradymonadaceae bacterium]
MRIRTRVDDDLELRAEDPEALEEAIEQTRTDVRQARAAWRENPGETELARLGRAQHQLAKYLLLAGEGRDARRAADRAGDVWEELERRPAAFLAGLRRADGLRLAGQTQRALEAFDELVDRAESEPQGTYLDFALEKRARCLVGRGAHDRARADLERCRSVRRERDRDRLVERTERMLELLGT